jgi:hypothetical protein
MGNLSNPCFARVSEAYANTLHPIISVCSLILHTSSITWFRANVCTQSFSCFIDGKHRGFKVRSLSLSLDSAPIVSTSKFLVARRHILCQCMGNKLSRTAHLSQNEGQPHEYTLFSICRSEFASQNWVAPACNADLHFISVSAPLNMWVWLMSLLCSFSSEPSVAIRCTGCGHSAR